MSCWLSLIFCFSLILLVRRIRMARRESRTTLLKAITELFHQHSSIRWATSEWASVSSSTTKTLMRRQVRQSCYKHFVYLIQLTIQVECILNRLSWQGWMYATAQTETLVSCSNVSRAWASMSSSTMIRHVRRWSVFLERVSREILVHTVLMLKTLTVLLLFLGGTQDHGRFF